MLVHTEYLIVKGMHSKESKKELSSRGQLEVTLVEVTGKVEYLRFKETG